MKMNEIQKTRCQVSKKFVEDVFSISFTSRMNNLNNRIFAIWPCKGQPFINGFMFSIADVHKYFKQGCWSASPSKETQVCRFWRWNALPGKLSWMISQKRITDLRVLVQISGGCFKPTAWKFLPFYLSFHYFYTEYGETYRWIGSGGTIQDLVDFAKADKRKTSVQVAMRSKA